MNGIIQKKKIVQNKKVNPFKKECVDHKKNKIESNCLNNNNTKKHLIYKR